MSTIAKLFQLRKALDEYEQELGMGHLSEVEKAVLSYITHNSTSTITTIKNDPYFEKYSLSTIKRAVGALLSQEIIASEQSVDDKRAMNLSYAVSL
ncbi:MAG: hypothetical protein NZ775_02040 [Gammaproteobacteria bacterium]|nr:hypothetical protein [Gammaproteobacteria bacterium]